MTNHPVLMFIHIGMGSLALLAGAGAMTFRKGSRPHRFAGNVFFIAMLIMSALGAYLAFVKPDFGTAIMGALTFYLVATAWLTVIRKEGESGRFEIVAMLVAAALAVTALTCGLVAHGLRALHRRGFPLPGAAGRVPGTDPRRRATVRAGDPGHRLDDFLAGSRIVDRLVPETGGDAG